MGDFWETVFRALPAVVPLATLVVTLAMGPGRLRTRIKHDVDLIEKLPASNARTSLLELVEREVNVLARYDTDARRDIPTFVVSLIVAPAFGYLTYWLATRDGWWTLPLAAATALLSLLFVYGIFETGQKVPRDDKGKRIAH